MKKLLFPIVVSLALITILVLFSPTAYAGKTKKKAQSTQTEKPAANTLAKSPYLGAIVIDAATGKVLFEDNADAKGYPASITKLMDLMILLEAVQSKRLSLQDQVPVTAEASKIGGSQVYLKEHEVFSVDELLYALIVQSGNDAAVALALHHAGSKEAFVELMNKRAQELGMKDTLFHSVHGLPPGKGQSPDVSTPRDIAVLCRALLKYPDTIRYTSAKERTFRPDAPKPFIMRSHNHLLGHLEGCDGLKTGYFYTAGFSIAATATKNNQRAIAVVFGSSNRKTRDAKAREILSKGLMTLSANAPPSAPAIDASKQIPEETAVKTEGQEKKEEKGVIEIKKSTIVIAGALLAGVIVLFFLVIVIKNKKSKGPFMV